MLSWIVDTSLRHRGVVVALACAALLGGVNAALRAKLDVFPDFVPPQVVIQTEAPGFAPAQVEQLVTIPIEAALAGLSSLESLRSESIQGLSVITTTFHEEADVLAVRQALAERLGTLAGQLPLGVSPPRMEPLTSSTMDVLKIGLASDRLSPRELRDLARWTLWPKLLSVPGVARINIFGGEVPQLQIQLRPEDLLAHGVSVSDVVAAASRATGIVGAGFIDTPNQRIVLRSDGQSLDAEALGQVALGVAGVSPVLLRDVATVVEAAAPRFGDATIQGRPGVLLTISSQYGSNTLEVTHGLERALDELAPLLAERSVELFPRLHRPATFIDHALRNLRFSLLLGAALVIAVLFLFLGHLRTTLISITAIPLSLLGAVLVLERFGITLNTMTLGGLAIALGEVVDDAIIDVENIVRRLRENRRLDEPRPAHRVVLDASLEVRAAVVYATLVVALVFLPLLTLSGLAGEFFAPLGLAYLLAAMASLSVALTLTPALCLILFGDRAIDETEPRLQRWIKQRYQRLLRRLMSRPRVLFSTALTLTAAAGASLPFVGGGFLPEFREGHLVLQVSEAPGASIDELLRVGRAISKGVLDIAGVATVEQQVGRAEQGEDTWGPHRSEFHVELDEAATADQRAIGEAVRTLLAGYPGLHFEVLTFLGDRISETLTGETAPVVVNLFGPDLDVLDARSAEVARILESVPGASEVRVKAPSGAPMLSIVLRADSLAEFGFKPVDLLEALRTAYHGQVVAQVHHANRVEDVVVVLADEKRHDPAEVGSLLVRSTAGTVVALRDLADIHLASGRLSILHEGGRRRQSVTCIPRGRDVVSFAAEAERTIRDRLPLPGGTYLEFGGTAQAQAEAQRELLMEFGIALLGVIVLLWTAFGSGRTLVLVLANIPFGLVGGVLAVLLVRLLAPEEGGLTMGSLVGFVTLLGITMRNSIMLVSHCRHLVEVEGALWSLETVVRGATDRVVPILMTALVTGLALVPLALGSGSAGREIEGPMATVILGGLLSSTCLNLLVLPALIHRFGRFGASERNAAFEGRVLGRPE